MAVVPGQLLLSTPYHTCFTKPISFKTHTYTAKPPRRGQCQAGQGFGSAFHKSANNQLWNYNISDKIPRELERAAIETYVLPATILQVVEEKQVAEKIELSIISFDREKESWLGSFVVKRWRKFRTSGLPVGIYRNRCLYGRLII